MSLTCPRISPEQPTLTTRPRLKTNLSSRTDHWTVVRDLLPYIWPEGRPDLRMRVIYASIALVIAKIITVCVPISYKWAVDWLTENPGETGAPSLEAVLPWLVVGSILAYGVGRMAMIGFTQVRDVLFTKSRPKRCSTTHQQDVSTSSRSVPALSSGTTDWRAQSRH